jgi:hypothetical protein
MSEQVEEPPSPHGPPDYDPALVGPVAAQVQIESVELVGSHFVRSDDGSHPTEWPDSLAPEIGINVEWARTDDNGVSVLTTFGTHFEMDDGVEEPYSLVARFRLRYTLTGDAPLQEDQLANFAHWNAMFNAWPYWREYLSSTLNRSRLPQFMVPVMGVPTAPSRAED